MSLKEFIYNDSVEQLREIQDYAKKAELEDCSLSYLKSFYTVFLKYYAVIPKVDGQQFQDWRCSDERIKYLIKEKSTPDPLKVAFLSALVTCTLTLLVQYINTNFFKT